MASSITTIEEIGQVRIYRRKGLKNIRITIEHDGRVRLSIPWYVPKSAGIKYLLSKKNWVKEHQVIRPSTWEDGQRLTDEYSLKFKEYDRKSSKAVLKDGSLTVHLPNYMSEEQRQRSIDRQVVSFLKKEAQKNLVPLLRSAAKQAGYQPKGIKIKRMKSRWGSCNQDKLITLNLSLVRLPHELAEYVIYHELAHTKHLNHGKGFWQEVEKSLPDYKQRRKALRQFNPAAFS